MLSIQLTKDDDPRFVALVRRSAAASVCSFHPADVFVVRINHWFDHKWFAFAGKLYGKLSFHKPQRLAIPPFIPGRVVSEEAFTLRVDRATYNKSVRQSLHRYQHSGENLSRSIGDVSNSAVFVWFSGDSAHTEHGSLMVYGVQGETQHGWYASFHRGADWKLNKVRGLSRAELIYIISKELDDPKLNPEQQTRDGSAS